MAKDAAPAIVGLLDAPEVRAPYVRDAVVLREPLVHERIVRGQQLEHAAIFFQNAAGKELGLAPEALAQIFVEIELALGIGQHRREVAQEQPLPHEIPDERVGARIGEHAAHVPLEDSRVPQFARRRRIDQRVVRDAAPEEKGQPRGQLEIADAVDRNCEPELLRVRARFDRGTPG